MRLNYKSNIDHYKIAAIYAAVSVAWVLLSDRLLLCCFEDSAYLTYMQTMKGWLYVLLSAYMLSWLVRYYSRQLVQQESTLLESEEKLRAILNHHYQLTGLMSADGTLLMANETALKMAGVKESDVVGQYFWDTYWWKHSPALQNKVKAAIEEAASGEFVRFETSHTDSSGDTRLVDFSLTPFSLQGNGEVEYIIPEGRDITSIKQHELALRESEERFRSIFESAAAPMTVIASDGTFSQVNQAACQFFGYPEEEFLKLKIDDVSLSPYSKPNHEQFEKLKSGNVTSVEYEKQYLCKDGSIKWGHSTKAAVRGINGELLHIVALTQNITDQKQAEVELVKHRDNLESLVTEKTQELQVAQEELIQQERLATLGKLTATVSHELRNPLGTISNGLNSIKAALEINDTQKVNRALSLSERNVYRCDRIIEELLNYGRKEDMEQKTIAIDELINVTLDEMEWPENVDLQRVLLSDGIVVGDKGRLRRVVINLVTNALQALQESTQSSKCVHVETRKANHKVEIVIEDNGPGVPVDLHEKIFEPLFSTKSFGVGLGMTVVKDIIQMHKGSVTLQTPKQQGCRFVIRIPISQL